MLLRNPERVGCFGVACLAVIKAPSVDVEVWLAHWTSLAPSRGSAKALSRDAVERRLAKYIDIADQRCPSLASKNVTMQLLRHNAAMRLMRAGVEQSVIALWRGHEQVGTTDIYFHADMSIKERALARTTPAGATAGRYKPADKLLGFLEGL